MNPMRPLSACLCCGSSDLTFRPALWEALVTQWGLSEDESRYVDRQQGLCCSRCGSNLRSMALALAIMRSHGATGGTFADFTRRWSVRLRLRVLEINEAGTLTQFLVRLRRRVIAHYPDVDMTRLPYGDGQFDLVVHSDTLEHVQAPVVALGECRRVLRPGGVCAYTVPIIVDRPTRSRDGLPDSFHGGPGDSDPHYPVITEYGADFWRDLLRAGFDEFRVYSPEHPASHAIAGVKSRD